MLRKRKSKVSCLEHGLTVLPWAYVFLVRCRNNELFKGFGANLKLLFTNTPFDSLKIQEPAERSPTVCFTEKGAGGRGRWWWWSFPNIHVDMQKPVKYALEKPLKKEQKTLKWCGWKCLFWKLSLWKRPDSHANSASVMVATKQYYIERRSLTMPELESVLKCTKTCFLSHSGREKGSGNEPLNAWKYPRSRQNKEVRLNTERLQGSVNLR